MMITENIFCIQAKQSSSGQILWFKKKTSYTRKYIRNWLRQEAEFRFLKTATLLHGFEKFLNGL